MSGEGFFAVDDDDERVMMSKCFHNVCGASKKLVKVRASTRRREEHLRISKPVDVVRQKIGGR